MVDLEGACCPPKWLILPCRLLNKRNVVIETLPVSNLRISQYRDIQDHHLLRWLCVKDCGVEGDAKMTVCMGSDDPGIFVSDLKNEFYHVFSNLRLAGLPPAECMEHIRQLNEAGRIYAFLQSIPEDELDVCGWPGYTTRRRVCFRFADTLEGSR